MANENVGVNLVEGQALSPVSGVSTAVSGIIGNFVKGPLNVATLVTSMTDFMNKFGSAPPSQGANSWYSVKAFFSKAGNSSLYIVRVASSTAAKATYTFQDQQGTPANTLKVDAINEGAWGNALSVDVDLYNILTTAPSESTGETPTSAKLVSIDGIEVGSYVFFDEGANEEYVVVTSIDTANKQINWSGALTNSYTTAAIVTTREFELKVYENNILVETWSGLSMNDNVSFFCESVVNGASNYIMVTDQKASDTDYQDQPNATASAISLASGVDGLSDVTGSDYAGAQANKTGVYAFDDVPGLFRFACPHPILTDADIPAAYITLVQAMLTYADSRVTVQYYGDVPYNQSVANVVTFAGNFAGRRASLWFPWCKVVESSIDKWVPPSGFVLGAAAAKDYRRGVHKSIGNEQLTYATDLKYHVSTAEGEILNDAKVNTIRKFVGGGIRTYGGRTLSGTTAWRFVNHSELWNYIAASLVTATQDVPFEPNDAILWKSVKRRIEAFLANEQKKGALFDAANPTAPAYTVLMDSTINPPDQIALGIAKCQVEYVPTGTAEKFVMEITSSPSGLSITS